MLNLQSRTDAEFKYITFPQSFLYQVVYHAIWSQMLVWLFRSNRIVTITSADLHTLGISLYTYIWQHNHSVFCTFYIDGLHNPQNDIYYGLHIPWTKCIWILAKYHVTPAGFFLFVYSCFLFWQVYSDVSCMTHFLLVNALSDGNLRWSLKHIQHFMLFVYWNTWQTEVRIYNKRARFLDKECTLMLSATSRQNGIHKSHHSEVMTGLGIFCSSISLVKFNT